MRDGQRPVQRYGPVEIGLRARKVASEQCDVPEVEPPQRLTGVIRYGGAQLALCARRVAGGLERDRKVDPSQGRAGVTGQRCCIGSDSRLVVARGAFDVTQVLQQPRIAGARARSFPAENKAANRSASLRRHSKQGRWPAANAVTSSRKNNSV